MKITKDESYIYTTTDYSNEYIKGARKLNGKWTGSQWKFDIRHEDKVRELLLNVYGSDGTDKDIDCVSVKIDVSKYYDEASGYVNEIEMFGRVLVYRPGRDSKVKLHDTVIISSGGFPSSGGSVKNPRLAPEDNTELEVLDVPRSLYLKELNGKNADYILLLEDNDKQIHTPLDKEVDKEEFFKKILDEKDRLIKRLKEIDELLQEM